MDECIRKTTVLNDRYKRALSSGDEHAAEIYKELEDVCRDLESRLQYIPPMKRKFIKLQLHRTDLKYSFRVIDAKRIMDRIAKEHRVRIPDLDITVFSDHFAKILPNSK